MALLQAAVHMHLGPLQDFRIDDQSQSFVFGEKIKLHDARSGLVGQWVSSFVGLILQGSGFSIRYEWNSHCHRTGVF
jgi:hypothetical protein